MMMLFINHATWFNRRGWLMPVANAPFDTTSVYGNTAGDGYV